MNELVAAIKYNCKYVILMGAILSAMGLFNCARRFDVIDFSNGIK